MYVYTCVYTNVIYIYVYVYVYICIYIYICVYVYISGIFHFNGSIKRISNLMGYSTSVYISPTVLCLKLG